ncbi:MAG: polysaccharide biosynthesis protein [Nitrospirae bacterium]|nr:MAG: polysaccharide biosynthesis protein [Nitrospirota bacterium]
MRLREKTILAIQWDTIGTVITAGLTFLTSVWIVRFLGPERFGVLAILMSVLALCQLLASGGTRYMVLRFVPEAVKEGGTQEGARLLMKATFHRTVMLTLVALPLWIFSDLVAEIGLGRPELAQYVSFLPLLLAPPLYADILAAGLIALFRQPTVRSAEVVNKIVFACTLLLLPVWPDPLYGVFTSWVVGWCIGILWLAMDASRQGLFHWPAWNGKQAMSRWVRFSGTAYALTLIGFILGRELDILLLTRLGIPSEGVAQYAVIFSFVAMVFALPLLPISGGFDVPLIADLYSRKDWGGLRRLYNAFFEYVYIFVIPIIGGGLLLGPSLVGYIYGEKYGTVTNVLFSLLVLLGLTKLGGITGPFLMAMDREGLQLRIRLTMAVVNIGLALFAIPRWGLLGAALATGASVSGMVIWEVLAVQRCLHPSYPWGFLGRLSLATGVMMIALQACKLVVGSDPGLLSLIALVGLGGAAYLAMLLWLRPVSIEHAALLAEVRVPGLAALIARIGRPSPLATSEATGCTRT